MALKDYVVFMNQDRSVENSTVVDLAGNKIFDIVNYGATDFGNRYIQPAADQPFYVIAWDGSHSRIGSEGQTLYNTTIRYGEYTQTYVDKIAFASNGAAYWHHPDPRNADRLTVWTTSSTDSVVERPTVVDFVGNGDPLFDTVTDFETKTAQVFSFGGAERFFVLATAGGTKKLISKALAGGAWTEHTIPAATLTNQTYMDAVGSNVILTINQAAVAAGQPTFFVAPTSTLVFDAGTALPGVVTTSQVDPFLTEWFGMLTLNDSLYARYSINSPAASGLIQFNTSTKAITLTSVTSTPLDVTVGGIRYTIDDPSSNLSNDVTPLTDGRWVVHANRWDTATGTTTANDSYVITNAAMTTIESVLHVISRETGTGGAPQDSYGLQTLRFNTHQITGNVTVNGTPTAGVPVGILNSNGKVNTTTVTDGSGNYTLTCLDGNPKQVVAYSANGTSEVHGQVTPTEVL